ncbi:MAG: hypothetical protein J6S71_00595 [Clostridia bacterium]|nr:hypothetical protein [Clostridia bacterium]
MNKVYALYHNEQRFELKITNEKHWEKQTEFVENSEKVVVYWNENLFLSFSRAALIEKANQIKNEWLQTQYKNISKIASIELRR